jgi:hypothetical protein
MQNIHRQGGRVTDVFMHSVSADQVAKPINRVEAAEPNRPAADNKKKKR